MRKNRKKIIYALFAVLMAAVLCLSAGCGRGSSKDGQEMNLYYLNNDSSDLILGTCRLQSDGTADRVKELKSVINNEKTTKDHQAVLPKNVRIQSVRYSDHQVYVYFNTAYSEMSVSREVLTRAAIVKTYLQLKDVSGVSFFVSKKALQDSSGENVGIMTNDTFATDLEGDSEESKTKNLTLYFSNKEGTKLVRETRTVTFQNDDSFEAAVLHELIRGPQRKNERRTIPEDVRIYKVSVMDGVCYVNFSSNFNDLSNEVNADVAIYSIVNSLTELSGVQSVQLQIEGDSDVLYRNTISLQTFFEQNTDLMQNGVD